MRIAMLVTASAVAFVFAIGSVSAADQFKTLKGVKAVQMTSAELNAVKGMDHHFLVVNPQTGEATEHEVDQHQEEIGPGTKGKNFVSMDFVQPDGSIRTVLVAPGYQGLTNACQNAVISVQTSFISC
jgi:hypothetical protein